MKYPFLFVAQLVSIYFFALTFSVPVVFAQTESSRSYTYERIAATFTLHTDASMSVEEIQTYRFIGEYHQGWRDIPHSGYDDISVRGVVDVDTGELYTYSSSRLEKTDPASWGKYTTFIQDGATVIEWYYNAKDTDKTFVLSYDVTGVVGFYPDHDELYWNLFTDYDVPVHIAEATVILPTEASLASLTTMAYVSGGTLERARVVDGRTINYIFRELAPNADVTIAPGWQKGIISASAYRMSWFARNWGYVGTWIVSILFPIVLFIRWYLNERYKKGRGTIIPYYEPPRNLRPAMADIVVHERLSQKAWSATIVDLAVRGYCSIEEIPLSELAQHVLWGIASVSLGIFALVVWLSDPSLLWIVAIPLMVIIFSLFKQKIGTPTSLGTEYMIRRKEGGDISLLETYETDVLNALFSDADIFSTKEMKQDVTKAQALSKKLIEIAKDVAKETADDTRVYEVGFRTWQKILPLLIVVGVVLYMFIIPANIPHWAIFFLVLVYAGATVYIYETYNPRLNAEGHVLREEILGFKMYLETAERYRLENLTPETFEKFLPYAMIFGVEKKWGKVFEHVAMDAPHWYVSHGVVAGGMSSTPFSPSAFSASFGTAFTSSFASSGGGGGAGGGL